jgi:thiamine biosynthesis lipoprotein ApbE
MMADAFSTAAFIMGEKKGVEFLEENGIEGLMMNVSQQKIATKAWRCDQHDEHESRAGKNDG